MNITPFAISGLLAGIFSIGFGMLVLFKSANKKLGRIWFLFCISAGIWGFGGFWIGISQNPASALQAWRFSYGFGVVWISTLFFHFVCTFCELHRPKTLTFQYIFSLVYFLLMPTTHFFKEPRLMFGSLYFPLHEWPFTVFVVLWMAFVAYSHVELGIAYRRGSDVKKAQIKYFFLGTAIGFVGGSLVFLPNFGVELYPWGNFTVFLYPLIMSYAIVRFNLMDIRVLIRRTALIVGLYLGLLTLSASVLALFHAQLQGAPTPIGQSMEVILISLILSAGPFLYAYVVRRNSYFQNYTLAGLTHELKSPLAVIESALDFLNNTPDLKNIQPEQLSSYLQMIQRNSTRLQVFVNDLLRAFDPKGRDVSLSPVSVDLAEMARRIMDSYTTLAHSKNLTLVIQSSASPLSATGDPIKIEQVFSNLLSNAIKFSERGEIKLTLDPQPNQIVIAIKDQGHGINHEELPYIFDRFYQGKMGRSRKGTGIGLTIAQLWVEAHGGKIWAESEGEGKGTTVMFTLPGGAAG